MKQSKYQSIIEVCTNVGIGMVGSWLITMACLWYLTTPVVIATVTTLLCTVWSLTRGYAVRRHFEKKKEIQNECTTILLP